MSGPEKSGEPEGARLGLFDTVSIIVGIVIGTTIFELPWLIFSSTPNPWAALAVWAFGGFLALVGGLCYAELGTTYPRAGGDYYYLTRAFGRFVGFLFGWAQLIIILPASIGVMAFVFANRASAIEPFPDLLKSNLSSDFYYGALAVLFITFLNLLGLTLGKTAQNILSVSKVVGLIAIVISGFMHMKPDATDWTFPDEIQGLGWGALAIILVLYAYGGWNDAAFVAAEVRDRRRNIPLALMLGIGAITFIYVLINVAFILGLGFDVARQLPRDVDGGLPEMLLRTALGNQGALAMNVIIMASALGAVNGLVLTGSRVYATLGRDHRLFGFLGGWRPGKRSPIMALLLQAIITVTFILLFGTEKGHAAINEFLENLNGLLTSIAKKLNEDWVVAITYPREWSPRQAFGELVTHSSPAFWLFFLLTGFSLFVLREKNPSLERPFSVPWYPILPIIFCNMCVYMLYQSTVFIGWRVLFPIALLLLGLPLYGLSQLLGVPRSEEVDRMR